MLYLLRWPSRGRKLFFAPATRRRHIGAQRRDRHRVCHDDVRCLSAQADTKTQGVQRRRLHSNKHGRELVPLSLALVRIGDHSMAFNVVTISAPHKIDCMTRLIPKSNPTMQRGTAGWPPRRSNYSYEELLACCRGRIVRARECAASAATALDA
jgi:hypothetical protein